MFCNVYVLKEFIYHSVSYIFSFFFSRKHSKIMIKYNLLFFVIKEFEVVIKLAYTVDYIAVPSMFIPLSPYLI